MDREQIMEQLNADDWESVEMQFEMKAISDIERVLDGMFPNEDNTELAEDIYDALN